MKKFLCHILIVIAAIILNGCAALDPTGIVGAIQAHQREQEQEAQAKLMQQDQNLYQQRMMITQGFNNNPDSDAWYDQRKKIALAMGDRIFDKDYGRVYDSLVVAVSSLELKVNNMERTSGYVSASGITLPPTESKTMYHEAVNDWCRQKGYDPMVLDQQFNTAVMQKQSQLTDIHSMMGTYQKMQKSLTFQMVKIDDKQTKVKLRFSDVFYPTEVESYYKMVWQAVDKQLFVDKTIEGKVEERK
jgi:hypothetical protein